MACYKKHHATAAHRLGQRAARRMALLSATVPGDQVDETYRRESEFLDVAVSLAADEFALPGGTRNRFKAAVGRALDEETDRILALITRGSLSPQ
jgi:hypothetical protein